MDTAGLVYDSELLSEYLRHALSVYNRTCPQTRRAQISVEEEAREANLDGLVGLVDVLDVFYEDECVSKWVQYQDGVSTRLLLARAFPAGAELTVHYTLPHSIAGLDGAELTTLPAGDESLVLRGAAGYAACGRAGRRAQGYDPQPGGPVDLNAWGRALLEDFRAELLARRSRAGTVAVWGE